MGNVKGDKNFKFIKELIDTTIPYKKNVILFGSRNSDKYKSTSDYDIFVIVEKSGVRTSGKLITFCSYSSNA